MSGFSSLTWWELLEMVLIVVVALIVLRVCISHPMFIREVKDE